MLLISHINIDSGRDKRSITWSCFTIRHHAELSQALHDLRDTLYGFQMQSSKVDKLRRMFAFRESGIFVIFGNLASTGFSGWLH